MSQTFCCAAMDIIANDPEFPIEYKPEMKRYYLVSKSKIYREKNELTQSYDIAFCPKCGAKLPKQLIDKWLPIIEKQFNVTKTLQETLKGLPKPNINKTSYTSDLTIEKVVAFIPKILATVSKEINLELLSTNDKSELKKLVANVAIHIKELECVMFLAQHIVTQDDCTKVLFYLYKHLLQIIEDFDSMFEIVVKAGQNHYVASISEH